ncbi:MAG TPA: DUF4291 domain-containing protein [Povalibacter sp.]|nr:DUF4291 domain-containing protein [Povalibacter sp.]
MKKERYAEQSPAWPRKGRHILAQYDADSICVYQAYRPSIAAHAVSHQRFGGEFSYNRMSWIKPNFLWMMYRAGWAQKEGQERILLVRLRRPFFDDLLRSSVPSTCDTARFATREEWELAVSNSDVRVQWDPDHDPAGRPLERRAVQLGLRGAALRRYGEQEIISIADITDFVVEQRAHLAGDLAELLTPQERVYVPDTTAARVVGIDAP